MDQSQQLEIAQEDYEFGPWPFDDVLWQEAEPQAEIATEQPEPQVESKPAVLEEWDRPYPKVNLADPVRLGDAAEVWLHAQDIRYSDRSRFSYAKTSITSLNKALKLRHPFFDIVVALSKMGKTALKMSIAMGLAESSGFVVLYAVLEMTYYEMVSRAIANRAHVDMNVYEEFQASPEDWYITHATIEKMKRLDFYMIEGTNTIEGINQKLAWVKKKHPGRKILLVVDMPDHMYIPEAQNPRQAMLITAAWLKSLTTGKDNTGLMTPEKMLYIDGETTMVSVLVSSQVPATVKRTKGHRLTIHDTTESAVWGNICTGWMVINDPEDNRNGTLPGIKEIDVAGRHVVPSTATVFFNGAQGRYEDPPEDTEEMEPI